MARWGGRRGEIGRTEILVALAAAAVLLLVVVPVIWSMSRKSARDVIRADVESIRQRELENMKTFSEYIAADATPRQPHAVDDQAVPWAPTEGFNRLGWAPSEPEVKGSYSVTLTPAGGFVVRGACDVDGDGHRAIYEATAEQEATLTTDASVY